MMECMDNETVTPSIETGPMGLSSSVLGGNAQAILPEDDVTEANDVAAKFSKYYYDLLERKPHKVDLLYLENAVLLWDGNPIVTRESIQKFVELLPPLTFKLMSLDCQQINAAAVGNMKSYIIKTGGQYRASGVGVKPFTQQIVITADGDKWRIASDTFRSQV